MSEPTITFDYPAGKPFLVTEEVQGALEEASAVGESVYEAMENEELRLLRESPEYRSELEGIYTGSSVNLLSPTVRSRGGQSLWADLGRWQARFETVDWLAKATSPSEAREIAGEGNVGVILNTQHGDDAIFGSLKRVSTLYNFGIRIFQLTYNTQTRVGTGCTDRSDGGVSNYGRTVIDRLNELGGIIDLSHSGTQTTLDTIKFSAKPVAFTHIGCKQLMDEMKSSIDGDPYAVSGFSESEMRYGETRAKTDEELEALAANGGYVGILGLPWMVSPFEADPPLEAMVDHLVHAASIVGVDRVGIGTDFEKSADVDAPPILEDEKLSYVSKHRGIPETYGASYREGWGPFERWTDFPVVEETVGERFSSAETRGIMGENFVDFWESVRE